MMSTILVVEDKPETLRPLARLLKQEGYNVITASDAYAAIGAIHNEDLDLILLDVGIPPMDGLTMIGLLRQEPQRFDTPVILLTGMCDENTTARASELGIKAHLVKSKFSPDELLATIKAHIRPPVAPPQ